MDFIFADQNGFNSDTLMQGDLLQRTTELREVLAQAHGYYAEADDYSHFMILTQSCDLVRRRSARLPKAPYITIAAVRPLQLIIDRRAEKSEFPAVHDSIKVCQLREQQLVEQYVERLLNNTEDGLFCLPLGCHEKLTQDLCVFLHLSVALRAEHYDKCLSAKLGQLEDIYAAKLGWLTGNMYSRVATPGVHDIYGEEVGNEKKTEFTKRVLTQKTLWLSPSQLSVLKKLIKQEPDPENTDIGRIRELIDQIPDDFAFVVNRVMELATNSGFVEEKNSEPLVNVLLSDHNLKRLVIRTIE